MSFYRYCIRPILFRFDPEWIHSRTLELGEWVGMSPRVMNILASLLVFEDPRLKSQIAGLQFPNPVGLAAGFDKSGRAIKALSKMGFGSVEIGSVSEGASNGNPKPRLFRLPEDDAVVVNYGVPNDGAKIIADRIVATPISVPLGVNLVETNTGQAITASEVVTEFVSAARSFTDQTDYLSLNLNCPNTSAGGSVFEDWQVLRDLMERYRDIESLPPVFLKFTATTEAKKIEGILNAVDGFDFVAGFIFNLPPGKPYELRTRKEVLDRMPGTLAGMPTFEFMNDAIRVWYPLIDRARHVIIGSGGIFSSEDAYLKIKLGASLLQIYTALIYRGPGLVKKINRGLCSLLERDGFGHLSEAIGVDN